MDFRDIVSLTIKMAGFLLLVLTASELPEYFKNYLSDDYSKEINIVILYGFPLIIPLFLAVVFIIFPNKTTNTVVFKGYNNEENIDLRKLEVVLIKILGLFLLYLSISDLVFHTSNYFVLKTVVVKGMSIAAYNYPYFISSAVELVFSLWLLAGTSNVIYFLKQIRKK